MPQMEALMSLTKIYIAFAVSAALAAASTGCRQFKELVKHAVVDRNKRKELER